jgi:hypothetical protein
MTPRTTHSSLALIFASLALAATGCTLEKSDDVSEYREALPEAANVRVAGPESGSDTGSGSAAVASGSGLLADGAAPAAATAEWYRFTRNVRDGVNLTTAAILGSVWYVAHTEPTTVGDGFAEWGPYTDALDPVTWRLRIERLEDHEYRYALEGRPRASRANADYLTVLSGRGYGRADSRHGDGEFRVDLDAARTLDPDQHGDDAGAVTITHDLPPGIRRRLGALPREITANIDPPGDASLTVTSKANEDGTGRIDLSGLVDVDDSKLTKLEEVSMLSRWRADGAGRADVVIAQGDVPSEIGAVAISECWASDFSRVYYLDSVNAEPTAGDASACVYDASDD